MSFTLPKATRSVDRSYQPDGQSAESGIVLRLATEAAGHFAQPLSRSKAQMAWISGIAVSSGVLSVGVCASLWAGHEHGFGQGWRIEDPPYFSYHPQSLDQLRLQSIQSAFRLSPVIWHRVADLLALQSGWDGESARAVRHEILASVITTLTAMAEAIRDFRTPSVAPTFSGGVHLEWISDTRNLEVEVNSDGSLSAVGTLIQPNKQRHYLDAELPAMSVLELKNLYRWFSSNDQDAVWRIQ